MGRYDLVDMLGDSVVYGFSLYVVARGALWQARAALLEGAIMAAFGVGVLVEVGLKVARGVVPTADLMFGVSLVALAANVLVVLALVLAAGGALAQQIPAQPGTGPGHQMPTQTMMCPMMGGMRG